MGKMITYMTEVKAEHQYTRKGGRPL